LTSADPSIVGREFDHPLLSQRGQLRDSRPELQSRAKIDGRIFAIPLLS